MTNEHGSLPNAWSLAWRSPAILFAVLMAPVLWTIHFVNARFEKESAIEHAKSQSASVIRIFQENTERIFLEVDRSLRLLRLVYQKDPAAFDLKFWAENASVMSGSTVQFTLIGADGYVVATTMNVQGPPVYLGDGEHFRKVKAFDTDDLYVGTAMLGRLTR